MGFPTSIKPGGVAFDIPLATINATDDGHADKLKQFTLQTGILSSALEHAVPEQLFVNAQNPGEAISAVKALQKANAQGQRIYHITQANQATILSNIHHDPDTMDEIQNALNAGKEVITHTDAISVPGWSGAGYIITDPVTGDGAYKISGGGNGGYIFIQGAPILAIGLVALQGVIFGIAISPLLVALTISLGLHIVLLEMMFNDSLKWDDVKGQVGFLAGLVLGAMGGNTNPIVYEIKNAVLYIIGTIVAALTM
jgi:hypothetical protein